MNTELFADLESRVEALLERYNSLKKENEMLRGENSRLLMERDTFKSRIDGILKKLEEV